jgi:hypothetical protein
MGRGGRRTEVAKWLRRDRVGGKLGKCSERERKGNDTDDEEVEDEEEKRQFEKGKKSEHLVVKGIEEEEEIYFKLTERGRRIEDSVHGRLHGQ